MDCRFQVGGPRASFPLTFALKRAGWRWVTVFSLDFQAVAKRPGSPKGPPRNVLRTFRGPKYSDNISG
eukprot:3108244-Pyramimonas_sp.AAC.1